jgi:hypothetical protein
MSFLDFTSKRRGAFMAAPSDRSMDRAGSMHDGCADGDPPQFVRDSQSMAAAAKGLVGGIRMKL